MQLRQAIRNNILRSKYLVQEPLWKSVWSKHINFLGFETKNWGDALNPVLIEAISGLKAKGFDVNFRNQSPPPQNPNESTVYLVIGSTLQHADCQTVVWGAGCLDEYTRFRQKPKKICAVRGPLSAEIIRAQGVECPDVYGDPALLFSRFYKPKVTPSYKLGIIPHYCDNNDSLLKRFQNNPDVLIIDIKGEIKKVVEDICRCERIVSSSLHGIIASDAYGIPSAWITISDNLPGRKGGFKFRDYLASIGLRDQAPYFLTHDTSVEQLCKICRLHEVSLDLDRLLDVCPFRKEMLLES
jgi:pyruvyltransferase